MRCNLKDHARNQSVDTKVVSERFPDVREVLVEVVFWGTAHCPWVHVNPVHLQVLSVP